MADREKVIKSLETCSDVYYGATGACSSCSFSQSKNCFAELVHQTIALLKEQEEQIDTQRNNLMILLNEQEAVEPKHNPLSPTDWFCGKCGMCISRFHDYCPSCGQAVRWG